MARTDHNGRRTSRHRHACPPPSRTTPSPTASITPAISCPGTIGVRHGGKEPLLGDRIAVADAARLHFDAHFPRPGLRQFPLDQLERTAFLFHLDNAYFGITASISRCKIDVGSPARLAIIIIGGL